MLTRTCAVLVLVVSLGCAAAAPATDSIVGLVIDPQSLSLTVVTTGCTKQSDFSFEINRNAQHDAAILTVSRNRADLCRKMPSAITFHFSLDEIGIRAGEEFRLANKLTALKPLKRR